MQFYFCSRGFFFLGLLAIFSRLWIPLSESSFHFYERQPSTSFLVCILFVDVEGPKASSHFVLSLSPSVQAGDASAYIILLKTLWVSYASFLSSCHQIKNNDKSLQDKPFSTVGFYRGTILLSFLEALLFDLKDL